MNRALRRRQNKQLDASADGKIAALLRQGIAFHQSDDLRRAEACYRQVLDLAPANADANHLSGVIAHQCGRHDDAIALISRAVAARPDDAAFHNNLGLALQGCGRTRDAIVSYRRATVLRPDYAEALCNMGNALLDARRPAEAETCYRMALTLKPDFAGAHYNLGNALQAQRRLEDSIAAFEAAIAIAPDYAKAHSNLGNALKEAGRFDAAMACFERARACAPEIPAYHSNIIFMQDFCADIDLAAQQAERRAWNEKFIRPQAPDTRPHANDRDPERRLRIGYVSADFRGHSACQGFAPLILDHDRGQFDVYCYAGNADSDAMTERLRAAATGWRATRTLSDDAVAETIRRDGIDILVDLSGHSDGNRLFVFARRPAPVLVTGIGHLAPGMPAIDYRLTTAVATHPAEEPLFPEQPVYLDTPFGFLPPRDAPPVAPLPCLRGGGITFGCLNRLYKISDAAKALWAQILREIPDSRLLIKFGGLEDATIRRGLEESLTALGAPRDRLILLGGTDQPTHLAAYNRIDIALDTFPQAGGITTLESLWMGVPVLGLYHPGKIVSRSIRTYCLPLGLDDWAADSPDDYLRRAVAWAGRREALAALRGGMRQRITDTYARFTADVERAYRLMWRRWCGGESPSAIDVAATAAPSAMGSHAG